MATPPAASPAPTPSKLATEPPAALGQHSECITLLGGGHTGVPIMALIASKCPELRVVCCDDDPGVVERWNSPDFNLPIYEPGLAELVRKARGKNLWFSTDFEAHVAQSSMVFLALPSPLKRQARRDSAEDFCRLKAPCCTAMAWIFIPAYCFALP